jgi:hypothetical protein
MIQQRGGAKSNNQKGPNQVDKNSYDYVLNMPAIASLGAA